MRRVLPRLCVPLGLLGALVWGVVPCWAGGPLHEQIDRAVESKLDGQVAAPATDAEFLRRVSLDLTGMIPTAVEARAFLDDPSPYKRERLIDRLLASPEYARRMATVFDVMLMERRDDAHVPAPQWREFLRKAFAENRPYNRLAAEILSADGIDPALRPAAKFYLDRQAEPNLLTRDVGRLFLGVDLQCAQCHDHPLIDDYKQAHYYGLFAFFNRATLFGADKNAAVLAEKADGDVSFTSVFTKKVTHQAGPRVIDGPPVEEPKFAKGEEYLVPPAKDNSVRPVPRFSRLAQLAPRMTAATTPAFSRNIVNRLWALMMGRGLVHPLDLHHTENPPSHPELLDLLAREFAASQFDVKAFLRELALSRTYQRSSEPPPGMSEEKSDPSRFAVAALKPLSPEQLAWSVMQGLGLVAMYRSNAEHRVDNVDTKLRDILGTDAKRRDLRTTMLEETVFDQLGGSVAPFVGQFAPTGGQPQDVAEPTVHQALFIANGQPIQSWLAPAGTNLAGRLSALTDPSALAEELYLSLNSRRPTRDERDEVARHLERRGKERAAALQELVWAVLASTEFRFNH
ncbi:MAG: DUF1549 domain-containing protein [Isosphaeraceae bacterium]|nr:DUF1549 domain-containing protein [Isosphaeraceae bacterium]